LDLRRTKMKTISQRAYIENITQQPYAGGV